MSRLIPRHLAAPHPSIEYTAYRNKCETGFVRRRDGDGVGIAIICTGIDPRHFGIQENVKGIWHTDMRGGFERTYPKAAGEQGANRAPREDPSGLGSVAAGLIACKAYGIARKAALYCYVIPDVTDSDFHRGLQAALERISSTDEIAKKIDVVSISVSASAFNSEMPRQPGIEPRYDALIQQILANGKVVVMAAGSAKTESEIDYRYCNYPARLKRGITAGSACGDAYGYRASARSLYYEDTAAPGYFRPNVYAPGQEIPLEKIGLTDIDSHDRTALASALTAGTAALGVEHFGRPLNLIQVNRIVKDLQDGLTKVKQTGETREPTTPLFLLNVDRFMEIIARPE